MTRESRRDRARTAEEASLAMSRSLLLGCARGAECLSAADNFAQGCAFALRILGESSGVDRVSLYGFESETSGVAFPRLRYEWRRERRNQDFGFLEPSEQEAIRWRRLLESSDLVTEQYQPAEEAPEGGEPPANAAEMPALRSMVAIPVECEGDLWGFLRLDSFHRELVWLETDEAAVRAFCRFLGAILSRQEQAAEGSPTIALSLEQLSRSQEIAFQLDSAGNWIFLSPAWDLMTGIPATRALGRHHSRYLLRPQSAGDGGARHLDLAKDLDTNATRAGEVLLLSDDGSEIWVSYLLMRLPSGDKQSASEWGPAAYQGVLVDIRDKKQHEDQERRAALELADKNAELLEALVAAQEATRLKSRFLATISHEIRTPLNGVLGMNALLMETTLDRRQREFAEAIRSSAESLLAIVSSILDYAKLEARRVEADEVTFDPATLIDDVFEQMAEPAARKCIDLVADIRYPIPGTLVGDAGKIRQILVNLVGNAVKFSTRGEVAVRLQWVRLVDGHGEMHVEVVDRGIGIAPETLQRLFRPFSQAEPGISRVYGGTGLGLAICKQLSDLMGGEISVESEVGAGSRFHVVLRLREAPESAVRQPSEWLDPRIQNHRVLLANFGDFAARAWRAVLQRANLRPSTVGGLQETTSMLEREGSDALSDVVVFDTQTLEGNGPEINRQLRLATRNPDLLVVLLDTMHHPVDRSILADVQPLIILRKPVSIRRALEHIAVALDYRVVPPRMPNRRTESAEQDGATPARRVSLLAASEARRKVLCYLLQSQGFGVKCAESFRDVLELAREGATSSVLLDSDIGEAAQMDMAERLRTGLGSNTPTLVAVAATPHVRDTLQRTRFFDTVLDPGFQRHALRDAMLTDPSSKRMTRSAAG